MRKIAVLLVILFAVSTIAVFGQENAQEKAKEIHDIAASDIIYTEQELKALYYQNIQIIDLLQEIRDLLQQQLQQQE